MQSSSGLVGFRVPGCPVALTRLTQRTHLRTVSSPGLRDSMCTVKTQWEREDAWFMGVSAMVRFVSPRKSRLRASSSEPAWWAAQQAAAGGGNVSSRQQEEAIPVAAVGGYPSSRQQEEAAMPAVGCPPYLRGSGNG